MTLDQFSTDNRPVDTPRKIQEVYAENYRMALDLETDFVVAADNLQAQMDIKYGSSTWLEIAWRDMAALVAKVQEEPYSVAQLQKKTYSVSNIVGRLWYAIHTVGQARKCRWDEEREIRPHYEDKIFDFTVIARRLNRYGSLNWDGPNTPNADVFEALTYAVAKLQVGKYAEVVKTLTMLRDVFENRNEADNG